MKSIRNRILASITILILISVSVIGAVSTVQSYQATMSSLELAMLGSAKLAGENIKARLDNYKTIMNEVAVNQAIVDPLISIEEKYTFLNEKKQRFDFEYIGYVDNSGYDRKSNMQVSDQDFYKKAMQGEFFISEPYRMSSNTPLNIVISAPVTVGREINAIVYAKLSPTVISNITNNIKISETSSAYALGATGNTIAHANAQLVETQNNEAKNLATDPSLKAIVDIESKLLAGETGFGSYSYGGIDKIMAYAPIDSALGWGVGITAEKAEFLAETTQGIIIVLIIMAICVAAAVVIAFKLAHSIAQPIIVMKERMDLMAQGDFKTAVPIIKGKDEIAEFSRSFANSIEMIYSYVAEIASDLAEMAEGDMAVDVTHDFKGDFKEIGDSIMVIANALNKSFAEITQAANQVASGSEQVASGAQALSQGATEQASAIEELSASITEISEQVKQNATFAADVSQDVSRVSDDLNSGNMKMADMVKAMSEISISSQKIAKIIRAIDDIAFQTNILSLNAAVEAARAGAAGKGFAVVADEVRNLAGKSAEAARETTGLIEESINAVTKGTKIADETAQEIMNVVDGAQRINDLVSRISEATNDQALSIVQVTQGLDQVSAVVQTNSATSQESAAASEELSSQATVLQELMSHFRLRDEFEQQTDTIKKTDQDFTSTSDDFLDPFFSNPDSSFTFDSSL